MTSTAGDRHERSAQDRGEILEFLAALDTALEQAVLVFGSAPPDGNDLDLLVRPAERAAVESVLAREGFVRRGDRWARFRRCAPYSVDLLPAVAWRLPSQSLAAVFAAARPLDGRSRVLRPAPHHVLLITARRLAAGASLTEKLRRRVDMALAEDPAAWTTARREARSWGALRAIARLHAAHCEGAPLGRSARLGMRAERLASTRSPARVLRHLRRRVTSRMRRPVVVALSGLDGAGKSSQARALRDALAGVGIEAVVEWTPEYNLLYRLPKPVRRVLRDQLNRLWPRSAVGQRRASEAPGPGSAGGRPNRPLTSVVATIMALVYAGSQLIATARAMRSGTVIICDRYTLDFAVHLRFRYGRAGRLGFQIRLMRALAPTPLRAFLLDVDADVALGRKVDQHGLQELWIHAELYREEHANLGVERLDGTRPREDLCAHMASEIWRGLGS